MKSSGLWIMGGIFMFEVVGFDGSIFFELKIIKIKIYIRRFY